MINCYFNANEYYVVGTNTEIYCSIDNPESDVIRQAYWTLILLLPELQNEKDNITFYNDSRLIDDMNGVVASFDDWTKEAKRISSQMLSSLYGIALFRKKEASQLTKILDNGRSRMINPTAKHTVAQSIENSWKQKHVSRVQKLKNFFFGAKNG